jgi:hypothetical protein
MARGSEPQRLLGKIGGSRRVRCAECFHSVKQRPYGDLVAGLGAGGQLRRDLDRQRSATQQDLRPVPVERTPYRRRNAGPNRVTDQVMPEGQPFTRLHKNVSLGKLPDRHKQFRDGQSAGVSQLDNCEPPSKRRPAGGDPFGRARHSPEAAAHIFGDAGRQPFIDEHRPTGLDDDELFLHETPKEVDEQKRIAVGLSGCFQQTRIWLCVEDVTYDARYRGFVQRLEPHYLCAAVSQLGKSAQGMGWAAARPRGEQPDDR